MSEIKSELVRRLTNNDDLILRDEYTNDFYKQHPEALREYINKLVDVGLNLFRESLRHERLEPDVENTIVNLNVLICVNQIYIPFLNPSKIGVSLINRRGKEWEHDLDDFIVQEGLYHLNVESHTYFAIRDYFANFVADII